MLVARPLWLRARHGAADQLARADRGGAGDVRHLLRAGRRSARLGEVLALRRHRAGARRDRAVRRATGSRQLRAANRKPQAEPDLLGYTRRPGSADRQARGPRPAQACDTERGHMDETFPDLGSLIGPRAEGPDPQLTEEETEISYRRRILHGKIDILRAELVNRLRKPPRGRRGHHHRRRRAAADRHPRPPGRGRRERRAAAREPRGELHRPRGSGDRGGPALPRVRLRQRRGRQLLPECGALLAQPARRTAATRSTATYRIGETGELIPVDIGEVVAHAARRS